MKHVNLLREEFKVRFNNASSLYIGAWPCPEADIFALQDKFLTNGFQLISVPNIQVGRELVEAFLQSLNCYHEKAVLTMSPQQLLSNACDLHQELAHKGYLDRFGLNDIEDFFIDSFYFDFMWIEATVTLISQPWFAQFIYTMCDFKIENHIPVVVLTSQKE